MSSCYSFMLPCLRGIKFQITSLSEKTEGLLVNKMFVIIEILGTGAVMDCVIAIFSLRLSFISCFCTTFSESDYYCGIA